jgi:hypothetical protein
MTTPPFSCECVINKSNYFNVLYTDTQYLQSYLLYKSNSESIFLLPPRYKRDSIHMKFSMTELEKGDLLIQVTA